jgi:putative PIN family toxin of toxin-antitoxin system
MGMLYDFRRSMQLVEVSEHVQECRDPGDDKFLSLALAGNASVIITGDDDLLVLHPFRNIAILSAFDYLMS